MSPITGPVTDLPDNSFIMHGAREVAQLTPGLVHIEKNISAIEVNVAKSPGFVFDLSKALIESVCTTILTDRGSPPTDSPDLPKLVSTTCKKIELLPEDQADRTEASKSFRKTANGLMTAIQGICEIRNLEGMASHGRDGYIQSLESAQAQFVARAADNIVNFLYKAHLNYPNENPYRRMRYDDNDAFNSWVDDSFEGPVAIYEMVYRQSEILFNLDRQAYSDKFTEFKGVISGEEAESVEGIEDIVGVEEKGDQHHEYL